MEGYPLFYDGMNEFGLAMAGLNFPADAHFRKEKLERRIYVSLNSSHIY